MIDKYGYFGLSDIKKAAGNTVNWVNNKVETAATWTVNTLQSVGDTVGNKISTGSNWIKNQYNNIGQMVSVVAKEVKNQTVQTVVNTVNNPIVKNTIHLVQETTQQIGKANQTIEIVETAVNNMPSDEEIERSMKELWAKQQGGELFNYVRNSAQGLNEMSLLGAQMIDSDITRSSLYSSVVNSVFNSRFEYLKNNEATIKNIQSRYSSNDLIYNTMDTLLRYNNITTGVTSAVYEYTRNPITTFGKVSQNTVIKPTEGILEMWALYGDMNNPKWREKEGINFINSGYGLGFKDFLRYEMDDKIGNSEIMSGVTGTIGAGVTGVGAVCTISTSGACAPSMTIGMGIMTFGSGGYDLLQSYNQLKTPMRNLWNSSGYEASRQVGVDSQDEIINGWISGESGIFKMGMSALMVKDGMSQKNQINNSSKVNGTANEIKGYLGDDYRTITNNAGDKIYISQDGLRKVRFDINKFYPHSGPHMDIEEFIDGNWKNVGKSYPTNSPKN